MAVAADFGPFIVSVSNMFYRSSKESIAFVNLRPVVPGHVLIILKCVVAQMADMTKKEYIDMWQAVRCVQKILQKHYTNCTAFNIGVQDGKGSVQSVPYVHVHILP